MLLKPYKDNGHAPAPFTYLAGHDTEFEVDCIVDHSQVQPGLPPSVLDKLTTIYGSHTAVLSMHPWHWQSMGCNAQAGSWCLLLMQGRQRRLRLRTLANARAHPLREYTWITTSLSGSKRLAEPSSPCSRSCGRRASAQGGGAHRLWWLESPTPLLQLPLSAQPPP